MKPPIDRFLKRIHKSHECECWYWQGAINKFGYGQFTIRKKTLSAHRFSYEHYKGNIPEGLTIDHLCRNRDCVNPDHLEAVTLRVNLLRGNTFQAKNAAKTHCKNGHPFNELNTMIVYGWRQCRECILIRKEKKRRSEGRKVRGRYSTKITRTQ